MEALRLSGLVPSSTVDMFDAGLGEGLTVMSGPYQLTHFGISKGEIISVISPLGGLPW
jgi:hypothetical protein